MHGKNSSNNQQGIHLLARRGCPEWGGGGGPKINFSIL